MSRLSGSWHATGGSWVEYRVLYDGTPVFGPVTAYSRVQQYLGGSAGRPHHRYTIEQRVVRAWEWQPLQRPDPAGDVPEAGEPVRVVWERDTGSAQSG